MKGTLGKNFQDRQRSANVRNLALDIIEKVLQPTYKDKKYQKELILRMAANLLPRLNEHSGDNGGPIQYQMINFDAYNTDTVSTPTE